jgi:cell division topological specificity factor
MTLFGFLRRPKTANSAETAKERLQILLAHERQDRSSPDYLPLLQKDILEAVKKYVQVAGDKVQIKLQRGAEMSTLEIDIELPGPQPAVARPNPATSKPAFAR